MNITVEKKIRKAHNYHEHIDVANVVIKNGKNEIWLSFSKFPKETEWKLDCQFNNKLPVFNHGEGDRCCIKKRADAELLEAIENAELEIDMEIV